MNDAELVDLLLGTDSSVAEMARSLEATDAEVRRRIRQLGMDWVLTRRRGSKGHAALVSIMEDLCPGADILTEQPIGERLLLDVYCPQYRLAAEYHGRQHFEFVEHFHGDQEGYNDSVRRDIRKILLCELKGIALVIFTHRDALTEDLVFHRMLKAIEDRPPIPESPDGRPDQRERQRNWRKALYQRLRAERKM